VWQYSNGDRGRLMQGMKNRFSTGISLYLGNDTRWSYSYNDRLIATSYVTIEWPHFQSPWTNLTQISRLQHYLTLTISETVRDTDTQYWQHNTKRDLHTPYLMNLFRITLSDAEWLSKIFNETKHRAVSATAALRGLSATAELFVISK